MTVAVPLAMLMLKSCVAGVPTPLLAVTVPVNGPPAVVGVPEMTPAVLRLNPAGNAPAVTAKVGAGVPEAVNEKS